MFSTAFPQLWITRISGIPHFRVTAFPEYRISGIPDFRVTAFPAVTNTAGVLAPTALVTLGVCHPKGGDVRPVKGFVSAGVADRVGDFLV